ncbi:MAG: cation transporter, partial [Candidatus Eisenbacteria bacterium]|nr:cation transporter [Candidatus Eisenbacteria bacterium]
AALWLVGVTLLYNVAEGIVAIAAGVRAESIALVGFGLDSFLEVAAATVLFWRLGREARGAEREEVERTERRVHRFVGATFLGLAVYVAAQSIWSVVEREPAAESTIGIVLAAVSLLVMPLVARGKLRAAARLGSAALRAEAKETLACSYLSFTLLLGLGAHAVAGWWWADPAAAICMVPWLVKEGIEGIRGEACECEE